ncbi:hypothetical protein PQR52_36615, partial [Paraburkholderia aspalathi]
AIGGAVSALSANTIATAVTGGQGITDQGQLAAIVAATTLLGGAAAGLLGQNVQGAVTAAQNETLNNACAHNCGEDPEKVNEHTLTHQIVPSSGGTEQDEGSGVEKVTVSSGGGAIGPASASNGAGTTTLYRAVGPGELADIEAAGKFQNLGSAEGKYFTTSSAAASSYAQQAVNAFGDPAYTTVTTQILNSVLNGIEPVSVDRGIPAYVVPNSLLRGLTPSISGSMAIPGKK